MTAVDTNVLVRLFTGDDPVQAATARRLFASGPIWIAKTVLLETSWVLRSAFGYEETAIREALRGLLGLDDVRVEDELSVADALDLMARGLQFGDALHLTSKPVYADFVSFDRSLVQRARRAGRTDVATP